MKYPKYIELYKIETLDDAECPQEEKYPSKTIIKAGFMWEHTLPKIDKEFYIFQSKTFPIFKTSIVKEIIEKTDEYIIFKTVNSKYKINIKKWKI